MYGRAGERDDFPNSNATTVVVPGGHRATSWAFARSVWTRLGAQLAEARRRHRGAALDPWFVWVPTESFLVAENLRARPAIHCRTPDFVFLVLKYLLGVYTFGALFSQIKSCSSC